MPREEEDEIVTHVLVDIDASALDAIDAVKAARAGATSLPREAPPSSVAPIPATGAAGALRPRLDSEPETIQPPKTLGVHGIGSRPSSPPSNGVVLPRLSTPVEEMSTLRNAAVVHEAKRQAMVTDVDDDLPPALASTAGAAREALASTDLPTRPGADSDFDDATDVDHVETTALLAAPAIKVPQPSSAMAAPPPPPGLRRYDTVVAFPPPPPPKVSGSLGPTRPPIETATDLFATDGLLAAAAPPLARTSEPPSAPLEGTNRPPSAFPAAAPIGAPSAPTVAPPLLPPLAAPTPMAPRRRRPLLVVAVVVGLCSVVAIVGIGATLVQPPTTKATKSAPSVVSRTPAPAPSPSLAPLATTTEAPIPAATASTNHGASTGATAPTAPPSAPTAAASAEPSAATPPHAAGSLFPRAGPSARPGLRRPGRPPWRPLPRPTKKPTPASRP